MQVILYYRYCKLDKVHEYQIVSDLPSAMGLWLWFHLGALFRGKEPKRMMIFPYYITGIDNETLKIYDNAGDAKQTAAWIHKRIMTHYKRQMKRR